MYIKSSTDLDVAIQETIDEIQRQAERSCALVEGLRPTIEALNLVELAEHTKNGEVYTSSSHIYVEMLDTLESRRIAHQLLDPAGLEWSIRWDAYTKTRSEWHDRLRKYISREEIFRRCTWEAQIEYDEDTRHYIQVRFDDTVKLQEGDTLPSGCQVEISYQAGLSTIAVACKLR